MENKDFIQALELAKEKREELTNKRDKKYLEREKEITELFKSSRYIYDWYKDNNIKFGVINYANNIITSEYGFVCYYEANEVHSVVYGDDGKELYIIKDINDKISEEGLPEYIKSMVMKTKADEVMSIFEDSLSFLVRLNKGFEEFIDKI
ncbi:hypothetical protein BE882_14845 [Listeria monocytogenes]|nr:hypothetical protein [Listeria monocytogenes]EAE6437679.1 hypothetical protein [Listeria monocytogenes]EAF1263070.1 hypothetical protein [Listeria monocytogenes]EAF1311659.1 hypothetical protein [Listeria monocytogenes]EAG4793423.1 hypothetical protein [Listeria monocytogenes]